MQLLLEKKSAIITGGTAGIGREIAIQFAKQGASVAICGTNKERAEGVLKDLEAARVTPDQEFKAEILDVSSKEQVEKVLGPIECDILVNNAGITRDNLLMRIKEEDWDQVLDINLKSVFNTCQTFIRPMMKKRAGKIINISSVVGLTGNAGQVNYAASKSGMIGLTKSLAQEVAGRGICVNCIAPGFIETRMTGALNDQQRDAILSKIPMKRMGAPKEIANAATFLASDMSNYVTGQVLTVDGGMVM